MTTTDSAPGGGLSLPGADCQWPDWWPAHAGNPACGERYCRRCEMEQEHAESHEGERCPWEEPEDKCRPVEVDGDVVRVLGGREMDTAERDAFADLVRAAKRRMEAESCQCTGITSQTGVDQNWGPNKVWRCDECGRIAHVGESL